MRGQPCASFVGGAEIPVPGTLTHSRCPNLYASFRGRPGRILCQVGQTRSAPTSPSPRGRSFCPHLRLQEQPRSADAFPHQTIPANQLINRGQEHSCLTPHRTIEKCRRSSKFTKVWSRQMSRFVPSTATIPLSTSIGCGSSFGVEKNVAKAIRAWILNLGAGCPFGH